MDRDEYLRDRLDDQIRWHGDKAAWNQRWFRRLQLAQIAMGALIPFASGTVGLLLEADSALPVIASGFLGVLIAFTGGVLALYAFQENWVSYRSTAEALKRERALYRAGVEPYQGADAFDLLVRRAEGIMTAEHTRWASMQEGAAAEG